MQPELAWIDTIAAPAVVVDDIGRPVHWNGAGRASFGAARGLDDTVQAPGVDLVKVAAEVARGNQRTGQTCDAVDGSGASWRVRIDSMGPGRAIVVFRPVPDEEDAEDEPTHVPPPQEEDDEDEPTAEIVQFDPTHPGGTRSRGPRWKVGEVLTLTPRPGAPARAEATNPRIEHTRPRIDVQPRSEPDEALPPAGPLRAHPRDDILDDVVPFETGTVPTMDVRPASSPDRGAVRLDPAERSAREPFLLLLEGRIADANDAACQALTVGSRERLVGRSLADLAPPVVADDAEPWEVVERALEVARVVGHTSFTWAFRRHRQADLKVATTVKLRTTAGRAAFLVSWRPVPAPERRVAAPERRTPAISSDEEVGRLRLGLALARSIRPLLVRDDLDEAIQEALATIGSAIRADRAFLVLVDHERHTGKVHNDLRYAWAAEGVERMPLAARGEAPERGVVPARWVKVLSSGGVLHGDAEAFPLEEQAILDRYGVQSLAIVPVQRDGRRLLGFLGLDACRHRRAWEMHEIEILKGMADSFAGAFRLRDAASEVREGRDRYETAVHGADLGVWDVDLSDGTITYTRGVDRLLGLQPEAVPRSIRGFLDMVHPDDREACRRVVLEHAEGRTPMLDVELRVCPAPGIAQWVLLRGRVSERTLLGVPQRAHGTLLDIDDRKRLEEELRGARGVAERASTSKSRFLATMSHEIRTPLNGVLGIAELLQGTTMSRRQAQLVDTLRSSGENLFALLNQIFDLSRIESGTLELLVEPFDLRAVLLEVRDNFRERAEGQGLALEVRLDERLPLKVLGDALRFRQVLLNLVDNAVKFTDQGGIVVEAWCPEPNDDLFIRVEVRDSGIGIPTEQLGSMFELFQQADASDARRHGGLGLGLAISARLCELMGGGLVATSEPGQGSCFRFDLRLGAPEGQGVRRIDRASVPQDLDVLLVEDNKVNQMVIVGMLGSLGCAEEVRVADCGRDALDQLGQRTSEIVLMDVQMPEMDGLECTQKIREHLGSRTNPWIIAVTASAQDRERCLAVGMNDFLAKPLRAEELQRALERAVREVRKRPRHPTQGPRHRFS